MTDKKYSAALGIGSSLIAVGCLLVAIVDNALVGILLLLAGVIVVSASMGSHTGHTNSD